jgi:NTP pyrophosphatase (non-canonical NTP hydrolase)
MISPSNSLQLLVDALRAFAAERQWEQFHTPKNLACALSVEVAELLEHFQWMNEAQSQALTDSKKAEVSAEAADVFLYLLQLCDKLFPVKPIKLVIAFPAGSRAHRHHHARSGRQRQQDPGPARGGGEQARRWRHAARAGPAEAPRPMATRWRRFRWACSACPTPPRSTGTRSRTSATCSTSPATPLAWWCRPTRRSRPGPTSWPGPRPTPAS